MFVGGLGGKLLSGNVFSGKFLVENIANIGLSSSWTLSSPDDKLFRKYMVCVV